MFFFSSIVSAQVPRIVSISPTQNELKTVDVQDNSSESHISAQNTQANLCDCLPGDASGDGGANVGDAIYILKPIFKGGPMPVPYALCSSDANNDCAMNIGDSVYLINLVFRGGPPPPTCEEWMDESGELR